LAELVQGRVEGDGDLPITAARPLTEAAAGHITFIENQKHAAELATTLASAIVVPLTTSGAGRTVIQVADPLMAFITIVRHLHGREQPPPHGIDPKASIHPTAKVGPDASIFPFAVIGENSVVGARCQIHSGVVIGRDCRIGDDVLLYPNCVLYEGTVLGSRAIVHANAVIGSDGFGYRVQKGRHVKVPQLGNVEIGDDVEVGACTTIDRGTFQATRIGSGTKIDNLVQIAHNCQIGEHNLLVAQVGIAGSSTTGSYVVMAGQVGIADHIHIGDGVTIGAQSGVMRDVDPKQRVIGAPARPEQDFKRMIIAMERLPDMRRDLRKVMKQLGITDEAA